MRIRVPATTGNTGPSFDSTGLAFSLYAHFDFERIAPGMLEIAGCGAEFQTEENLAIRAFRAVERRIGAGTSGVRMASTPRFRSRGLGSSATLIVAGAFAANELYGAPLGRAQVLEIAARMEGHPDNAAPALYGGLCASAVLEDGQVLSVQYPVDDRVRFVALIPDFPLSTAEARRVLPDAVPRKDVVFNLSRAALLMRGMEAGDFDLLSVALDDRIHTPYRKSLIHASTSCEAARGRRAGAWLSPAPGRTLLALSGNRSGLARDIASGSNRFGTGGARCRCRWTERARRS